MVSPQQGPVGASRVLRRISSCMPRPVDSGGPPHPRQFGCFVLPSGTLKPSASAICLFRSCTNTSGCATTPTAYTILCLRLAHLVRLASQQYSAMDPRLDTAGWLALTEIPYGVSPDRDFPPSLSRRDNAAAHGPQVPCSRLCLGQNLSLN